MPRPSTIDRLPQDVLEKLQELLRDARVTQLEATARINAILADDGDETRVSKSAVNRYSMRMEEIGKKLRQSREIAAMWIGKLGAAPQGEVGLLLNEIVRNLAFDTAVRLAEGEEPVPPKLLKELSIAVDRLERAATEGTRRAAEIRKQAAAQAVEAVEAEARTQGASAATIDALRAAILKGLG